MGHDIYSYRARLEQEGYLRRTAFDELNQVIYELLDCEDAYGGVSGNGAYVMLEKDQIATALEALQARDDAKALQDEAKFLKDCLRVCSEPDNEYQQVMVHFG